MRHTSLHTETGVPNSCYIFSLEKHFLSLSGKYVYIALRVQKIGLFHTISLDLDMACMLYCKYVSGCAAHTKMSYKLKNDLTLGDTLDRK